MADWEFEHSVTSVARRSDVWDYWTDMGNHVQMEPGVENIELDGPFATGTTLRTVTGDHTQELELSEVIAGDKAVITGYTGDGTGMLRFAWKFEDEGGGTRMTQRITASGPGIAEYLDEIRLMEENAPKAMARLAAELDRLAREERNG